jgi:hypothetical protein
VRLNGSAVYGVHFNKASVTTILCAGYSDGVLLDAYHYALHPFFS